jgi:hypothetical protein
MKYKQEDHGPGQSEHKVRLYLKNNQHKKGYYMAETQGLEFNPQYHQKKKKR